MSKYNDISIITIASRIDAELVKMGSKVRVTHKMTNSEPPQISKHLVVSHADTGPENVSVAIEQQMSSYGYRPKATGKHYIKVGGYKGKLFQQRAIGSKLGEDFDYPGIAKAIDESVAGIHATRDDVANQRRLQAEAVRVCVAAGLTFQNGYTWNDTVEIGRYGGIKLRTHIPPEKLAAVVAALKG